ncbi:MAG: ATP-dependent metallopeptidase FtsH/Yme1/Tma family protein [Nitrospinota bacterium]|nr:MAG: ATP-dependent metallopeptidase FtsH/Yme1/Tma family protein [Nitrospinota bacterium]
MATQRNDNQQPPFWEWLNTQLEGPKKKKGSRKKLPKRAQFSIWYFLAVLLILIFIQHTLLVEDTQKIPYSEFKRLLREGKVDNLIITKDTIRGEIIQKQTAEKAPAPPPSFFPFAQLPEKTFTTIRIEDPELVKELDARNIRYTGRHENRWLPALLGWIIPILIFFGIWSIIFRRMGPGGTVMSFGRSRAKLYAEDEVKVTFDDVAGVDEAKEELQEVVEFLKNPQKFQRLGGRIPKGVLLIGPPGTGKTLLARAVAGESKVPFFSMSGSDFVEMFVGVGAARVRDLFAQAQEKAPCIIFIDELDALGKARGSSPLGGHEEREQTLNQLLVEMDGFDSRKGVIILAATNRPEMLDPALLRPGRFDRQVLVDRPDLKGREAILRVHAKEVKLAPDVDLSIIAARTPGFVGADLANVINEAALLAARRNKTQVEMADLEEAVERVVAGLEKKNRVMNDREKEIVAYHEAGHALVAASLPFTDPVHKISIIPRGVAALGYTLQLPLEDRYLMTRTELLNKLAVLLGGRVAEELVFHEVSTGAQNDLQRVADIARRMVVEYGMSEKFGPMAFEKERRPLFLDGSLSSPREYSEETAREIDMEVEKIVTESYERVKQVLEQRRDRLELLAKRLLEKEVIEGEELRALLYPEQQPGEEEVSLPTVPEKEEV